MPIDQVNSETTPLLPQTNPITPHSGSEPEEALETMSATTYWRIGAVFGATAVGLGAFGAHGLKKRIADPGKLANWSTAAQYQVGLSPPFSISIRILTPNSSSTLAFSS